MAQDLQTYHLAFALDVCRRIVSADDTVDAGEISALHSSLPLSDLAAAGLVSESGELTAQFHRAITFAAETLREQLPLAEKLALVALFHAVSVADGSLDGLEYAELQAAAGRLGLTTDQVGAHLDSLATDDEAPPRA